MMKIKNLTLVILFLFSIQLHAQTLLIAKGWQMLGAQVDITDINTTFTNNIVYAYQNGGWSALNSNEEGVSELTKISAGEGFWLNGVDSATIVLPGNDNTDSSINLTSGWQIKAAKNSLCSSQIFADSSVQSVYRFVDNNWKVYEANSASTEYPLLTTLEAGNGFWINSTKETTLHPTLTVSGNVVDGYIKDAKLEVASLATGNSLSILSSTSSSVLSSDNGAFSLSIANTSADTSSGIVITSTSGTDEATGETYEGLLKTVISTEGCQTSNELTQNITPITTLVTESVVDSQNTKSKSRASSSIEDLIAQAKDRVAQSIGISSAYIDSDPHELLRVSDNENTRSAAAKIIKTSLAIQKTAEMMASTIVEKAETDAFNSVASSAFKALASSISSSTQTGDIETLLADTDTLITKTVTKVNEQIKEKPLLAQKIVSPQEKLTAAKDVIQNSTDLALKIKEDEIVTDRTADIQLQIETVQKSLEIVTRKIEEKAQNIAKATTDFAAKVQDAQDVIKTIAVSGGVEGTKALINDQIKTLGTNNQTIDVAAFSNQLFSDERIAVKKQEFEKVFGVEFDRNVIGAATNSYENIVKQQTQGEVLDQTYIEQQIKNSISELPADKQTLINQNVIQNGTTIINDVKSQVDLSNGLIDSVTKTSLFLKPPVTTTLTTQANDNLTTNTAFTKEMLVGKTFFIVYQESTDFKSDFFGLWALEELRFEDTKVIFTGISDINERDEYSYTLENGILHITGNGKENFLKVVNSQADFLTVEAKGVKTTDIQTLLVYANKDLALEAVRINNKTLKVLPLPSFEANTTLTKELVNGRTFYEAYLELDEPDSAFNLKWIVDKIRFTDTHIITTQESGIDETEVDKYSITNQIATVEENLDDGTVEKTTTKIIEIHPDYLLLEHTNSSNLKEVTRLYLSLELAQAYVKLENEKAVSASTQELQLAATFKDLENRRLFMISGLPVAGYQYIGDFYLNAQTKTTSNGATYQFNEDGSITIVSTNGVKSTIIIKNITNDFVEASLNDNFHIFLHIDRYKADQHLQLLNSNLQQPILTTTKNVVAHGIYAGSISDILCDDTATQYPLDITISDTFIKFLAKTSNFFIEGEGKITPISDEKSGIVFQITNGIEFAGGLIDKTTNTIIGNWSIPSSEEPNKACGGSFNAKLSQ